MAFLRIQVDLAIPADIAKKTAVKAKLLELYALLKLAKAYSIRINDGSANEEDTTRASYRICHHDENNVPCEPEVEI